MTKLPTFTTLGTESSDSDPFIPLLSRWKAGRSAENQMRAGHPPCFQGRRLEARRQQILDTCGSRRRFVVESSDCFAARPPSSLDLDVPIVESVDMVRIRHVSEGETRKGGAEV